MNKVKAAKVEAKVQIDAYAVIRDAVEKGVGFGVNRGLKHMDHNLSISGIDYLVDKVSAEVMSSLCEILKLGENE